MQQEQKDIIINFLKEKLNFYDEVMPHHEAEVNAQNGEWKEVYQRMLYKLRIEELLLKGFIEELEEGEGE